MRHTLWLTILVALIGVTTFAAGEAVPAFDGSTGKFTQQVAGNGVTVTATLLKDQPESTAIKLALDTYFVNLIRYDFEELAILRDDTGKTYPLTAVEQASPRKLRYRQAVLRFGKVNPDAKTIELIVKDVAGVKERTFRWSTTN